MTKWFIVLYRIIRKTNAFVLCPYAAMAAQGSLNRTLRFNATNILSKLHTKKPMSLLDIGLITKVLTKII